MDIFPVDWEGVESETSYEVRCYGKLEDGRSACVRISFFPYFYAACPSNWSASRAKVFVAECASKLGAILKFSMPITRKTLWGFTNAEPRLFVQLAFPTVQAARQARRTIADRYHMHTYEASVDHIIRLFHVRAIAPAQWIHVSTYAEVYEDAATIADVEVRADFQHLRPSECKAIPPIVLASWDIECYSASGAFPLSENPGDVICTICTTFQRYGEAEPYLKHAVTLGSCDPIEGITIQTCETEAELINCWTATLKEQQTDVLIAWNSYGFDYKYLYGRSLVCVDDMTGSPLVRLDKLGKAVEGGGKPVQKQLSSAAYGDNNYFFISAPGCLHLDLMQLIKKEHKLDSYSLNAVAEKFLGDRKIDLKPAEIFEKFKGTAADRAIIVEYCAKDTLLPLHIMEKLSIFQNMLEMANATSVPVDYLITRGQQIKVFSLILKKARSMGYVCPDMKAGAAAGGDESYEGATVLDAHKGAYLEDVVSALDFASLYPSIIRAWNFCPSTLVMDSRYMNLPGIEYHTVTTPQGAYTFALNVPSVLPSLLSDLAEFRKQAKREMAKAKDDGNAFEAAVQNGRQLAFKVSMNSAYGFFGATKGFLPCLPIASSVTSTGREMIAKTKHMVETLVPGSRVVYGDSVAGYTPILLRHPPGGVELTTFHRLADMFRHPWITSPCGKQYLPVPPGVDIWSDKGWTPLIRVIRHATAKRMFRVITRTAVVDVTEDHSLLLDDGTCISPLEITVGDRLLHRDLPHVLNVVHPGYQKGDHHVADAARFLVLKNPIIRLDPATPTGWFLCDTTSPHLCDPCEVLAITELSDISTLSHPFDPYVYDATTLNHHFAAGVGRLVLHNTDSVMCIFNCGPENRTNMHEHFKVAQEVADTITNTFRKPNELEFEVLSLTFFLSLFCPTFSHSFQKTT